MAGLTTDARPNLKDIRALVVDSDAFEVTLLVQMLHGLGMDRVKGAASAGEAGTLLDQSDYALCICDSALSDGSGADFIRSLRARQAGVRAIPVIALTGHADRDSVTLLRDAGANLVLKKPLSARLLRDRIAWLLQNPRKFIESATYIGPDRRFRSIGPPGGVPRRATDLSIEVGAATEPNLSQDEIDLLMRPTRVLAE